MGFNSGLKGLIKFIPSLHAISEWQFVPYFVNIPFMYLDMLSILSFISFKFVSKHFEGVNVSCMYYK